MAYVKKTWKPRISQYPGRRRMVGTGEANTYDITRAEGTVTQTGDAFSAANMNDLETRIGNEFTAINNNLSPLLCGNVASVTKTVNTNASGTYTEVYSYTATQKVTITITGYFEFSGTVTNGIRSYRLIDTGVNYPMTCQIMPVTLGFSTYIPIYFKKQLSVGEKISIEINAYGAQASVSTDVRLNIIT